MEREHEPRHEALRPRGRGLGHLRRLDAARRAPRRGHQPGGGRDLGRRPVPQVADHGGAPRPRRRHGVERLRPVDRQPGPQHLAPRRAAAGALHVQAGRPPPGGLRAQVVLRRAAARLWRQRQQVVRLELALLRPSGQVQRAPGRGEGDRLVPAPAGAPRVGRGHRGPVHPLLEHREQHRSVLRGHRIPGVQLDLVRERQ
mmetsp:Transcript_14814/g.43917  ORF Transcript_14814/g.43917 Transcript_14814/m.43917 type:complete len:200 (+) Transcript_14814:130-729(+)